MSSTRLIINEEDVELVGAVSIPLNLQIQNIGELSEKVGSYSRSFTIKATSKNKSILQNAFTFQTSSSFAYRKHPAEILVDGLPLYKGVVIVEDDGAGVDEIRLTFYTGNSEFFINVANRKLRDFCFKEAQHFWWSELAYKSRLLTEDYLYPIITYRLSQTDITTAGVDCRRLLPAIPLRTILDKVAEESGYTLIGDALTDDYVQRIVYPFSSDKFIRDLNFTHRNNWRVSNDKPIGLTLQGSPDPNDPLCPWQKLGGIYQTDPATGYPINELNNCCRIPLVDTKGFYQDCFYTADRIYAKLTVKFLLTNDNYNTDFFVFIASKSGGGNFNNSITPKAGSYSTVYNNQSQITYNGVASNQYGTGGRVWSLGGNGPIQPDQNSYEVTYVVYADFYPHFPWAVWLWADADFQVNKQSIELEFIRDIGTTETDRTIELDKIYGDGRLSRSLVSPSVCIPDVTAGTFLKGVAAMLGASIIINEKEKTLELFYMNRLLSNTAVANDWSDKVVNIKNAVWGTRPKGYGKSTKYLLTNIEGYSAEYGGYTLTIDDETLENEKTFFKLPYSACPTQTVANNAPVPYIQRMDANGNITGNSNTKQHALLTTNFEQGQITLPYGYSYLDSTNTPVISPENSNSNVRTAVFSDDTEGIAWDANLFQRYHSAISRYVQRYQEVTLYLYLSPTDVKNLDFRIPIYLRQFNSYFFIQKVNDWIPNKPAKVELIKIK